MAERCHENGWRTSGGCQEDVMMMSGECQMIAKWMSRGCQDDLLIMSEELPEGDRNIS